MKHKILILEDETKLRNLLGRTITLEGFEVTEVETCEKPYKTQNDTKKQIYLFK